MLCRPEAILVFTRIIPPGSTTLRRLRSSEARATVYVTLERIDLSSFEVLYQILQA